MKYIALATALVLATPAVSMETATLLADGQQWNFQDPGGRTARLTLNPDGTGRVRLGLMGTDAVWVPTSSGLCLTTRPLGEVCLALEASGSGFVGATETGEIFTFWR